MDTRTLNALGLTVLLGVSGCAAPRVQDAGREARVRAAIERYYEVFSARDWAAFRASFWPGATFTTVWQPPGEAVPRVVVHTLDEFLAGTAEGPDSQPIFAERLLAAEVRLSGNLAQAWARYEAQFGAPGSVATWRGIDALTLMEHGGEWRIVSLAFTDEPGEVRGAP
jgi:hypothetical protein